MPFEPIAVVGRSCVLPGALDPTALWNNVRAGRDLVAPAPEGRWSLPRNDAMGTTASHADRTWTDAGGYVTGFDAVFDPTGFRVAADEVRALDAVFRWTLHGVREALRSAKREGTATTGLVMGNLSFPSASMAAYAEHLWLVDQGLATGAGPHPRNRFTSGMPALYAAKALGLGAGALALDAACASSLYAIKLACDRLQAREVDTMVAGAVSAADDLFIHIGFCALSAMSRTGRSRPFDKAADGLVPAEGAAFVVLRRLSDAVRDGDTILGVIRGVGLSNDGRGRGLLAPSEEGQVRAMRAAWASAGLAPSDVGLVECHATGTPVGDAVEVHSMAEVFAGARDVPIGSLKSNLGHLITAAGAAGLLKVIAAMEAGERPPTLHADDAIDALAGTPFRLLREPERWMGPKRATVSAFGFGGNNAHLIVEAFDGASPAIATRTTKPAAVAIVGIGARVGSGDGRGDFVRTLMSGRVDDQARESVVVDAEGLRFPPKDLEKTHAQQLMVLEAAREAAAVGGLDRETTAVIVGMGTDPAVARHGARWRLGARTAGAEGVDATWIAQAKDALAPTLEAAGVVGTMPNMPANRVCSQLDLGGMGFTVSAEEGSGLAALRIAAHALRAGEIDAALVGAVDLSHDLVHAAALHALGVDRPSGDAAVVLTLRRLDDARADGQPVLAVLDEGDGEAVETVGLFGHAHAATSLVDVAAAALAVGHGFRFGAGTAGRAWLGERKARVETTVLDGANASVTLRGDGAVPLFTAGALVLRVYSGGDRAAVAQALAAGRESSAGPARLVLVGTSEEMPARVEAAQRALAGGGAMPEGAAFGERAVGGDVASVFTGAAAGYVGMGRDLTLAFPALVEKLGRRSSGVIAATRWAFDGGDKHPLDQLWGTTYLCQLHALLVSDVFGLKPRATLGYSSGETNALFAAHLWNDFDAMMSASREAPLFKDDLCGEFRACRTLWGLPDGRWQAYSVVAPVERVREALAGEANAHLTIINAPDECVIGGESLALARVVAKLGGERCFPMDYEMAAHCPEIGVVRDAWWSLHHRAVTPANGLRFYSNGTGHSFAPTSDAVADAITAQAVHTLDLPRTIVKMWEDGVRVFIEHGPRGACSGWIKKILGAREHIAVPLDLAGRNGVRQAAQALAALIAAGVDVDASGFLAAVERAATPTKVAGRALTFAAHPKAVRFPPRAEGERMEPAPALPSMLADLLARPPRPVTDAEVVEATEMVAAVAKPAAVTVSAPTMVAPKGRASVEALAHLAAFQGQLATMHRAMIEEQAAQHERFLDFRQRSEAQLLAMMGSPPGAPTHAPASVLTRRDEPAHVPERAETATRSLPSAPLRVRPVIADVLEPTPAVASTPVALPGPKFDRAQLEVLAGGKISSVFGPLFEAQDGFHRQVRMPMPPLLFADRVTGIDAVAGSMKLGTIWTETDVRADAWYLGPDGRMPGGVMIESGQADLLLISWLGVDLLNQSERVYRLLGCELTYHGELPRAGDTLVYDIHIDGHANQGPIRLFFFHYDCRVNGELRLSVRHGQAGFFTDAELADSGGILWSPDDSAPAADARLDAPPRLTERRRFSHEQLVAFSEGRTHECFGPGFEATLAHVATPRIAPGRLLFPQEVVAFDPTGGPWQRGYLRAEQAIHADDWYFEGHFKNDPCMPGTLMFEGCLATMAFHLAALGFTIDRDGWRFEPVTELKYLMRCRGQVTRTSRKLTYEVFVSEVHDGPLPTLYADLLCTVDGLKAFHARRVGMRLIPAWPLDHWESLSTHREQETGEPVALASLGGLAGHVDTGRVASVDGFSFGYASLIACAWGRPSRAFGPFYERFDSTRRVARLPGPPYHFMSRITDLDAPMGALVAGGSIACEYDVPASVWYFAENGAPVMPLAVLMEAALQPCGWFASYIGSALTTDVDLLFRNLDGTGTMHRDLTPGSGPLRTKVKLKSVSRTAGMIIVSFLVSCSQNGDAVYDMDTVFGFFPKEAFENQAGLPTTDEERARLASPNTLDVDLTTRPARYCGSAPRLAGPMLLMLDRVTAFDPTGGKKGLGWLRAEKDVDAAEWFFKAHFFQDPVQPGSLGIEALAQLIQFFMLETGMAADVVHPRFEALMTGRPLAWKYRGQVVPKNKLIQSDIEIVEVGRDALGPYAVADCSLWVDGKRIYQARNFGMRIVAGDPPPSREETLDPARDTWLNDHRPTWTVPALPMMSMVDRLASVDTQPATVIRDVRALRWLAFAGGPQRLRVEHTGDATRLLAWRDAANPALSRFEPVAEGIVSHEPVGAAPVAWAPLADAVDEGDPYESGRLFHGPSFRCVTSWRLGPTGASAVVDAARCTVPRGTLHQGLLDAMTHAIPHDSLWRWSSEIPRDVAAYPHRVAELRLFAPLPDVGTLRIEARFDGFDGDPRFPVTDVQLIAGDRVLATMRLVEVLLPKGSLGVTEPLARRAFLEGHAMPGVSMSRVDGAVTTLDDAELRTLDWLPNTVARIYHLDRPADATADVAVKEHVARAAFVHPATVRVAYDGGFAAVRPFRKHPVTVTRDGSRVAVRDAAPPINDFSAPKRFWRERLNTNGWLAEDIFFGLIDRFVGDVVITDPAGFATLRGRPCLFLANHQIGIESLLFSLLITSLTDTTLVTVAKAEHRTTWIGRLIASSFSRPGLVDPGVITFFDRDDPSSLQTIARTLGEDLLAGRRNALIHVEGTRSLAARHEVLKIGSTFLDLAVATGTLIVPVRFAGALPVEPLTARTDFPVGFGRQDYWVGPAIPPEVIAAIPLKERRDFVRAAINQLGPPLAEEVPHAPDPALEASIESLRLATGAPLAAAVLRRLLEQVGDISDEARVVLAGGPFADTPDGRWLAHFAQLVAPEKL